MKISIALLAGVLAQEVQDVVEVQDDVAVAPAVAERIVFSEIKLELQYYVTWNTTRLLLYNLTFNCNC